MSETRKSPLAELVSEPYREKQGIIVTRELDDPTVWDGEAAKDPLHAVVSAENEDAERAKSEPQIEAISGLASPSTILLDLGCGYGRIAKYLLARERIAGYIGVDSAITMLQLFKQRYDGSSAEQRTPALFVNSDIATIPIEDASVDLVVVSAVFLHNPKPLVRRSMAEVSRVLKPGGRLLVFSSFPRRASLTGLQGALYHALLNWQGKGERNGPVRYYSKSEMAEMLSGFAQYELRGQGFTFLPKSIIGLRGLPERLFRRGLAEPVNRLVSSIVPRRWHPAFAVHYDVVATK